MSEIILYDEKTTTAISIFGEGGANPFIKNIKDIVDDFEGDLTTEKGRKEIISLAYKISNAKNQADKLGKAQNDEHQDAINKTNAERKRIWNELEALQKKVRKPVTDWEDADKERIDEHKAELQMIEGFKAFAQWDRFSINEIQTAINGTQEHFNREWQEFQHKATKTKDITLEALKMALEARKKYDVEQAEAEKLRKAEERAKKAAEEKAKRDHMESEAKVEVERKAAQEREAEIQRQKEKAEHEKKAAEERAVAAEKARKEQEERAKREAEEAFIQAKKNVEEAARRERERLEAEQKRVDAEKAKREADVMYKNNIIREIEQAFVDKEGFPHRMASSIAAAIVSGKIPHVTINY